MKRDLDNIALRKYIQDALAKPRLTTDGHIRDSATILVDSKNQN